MKRNMVLAAFAVTLFSLSLMTGCPVEAKEDTDVILNSEAIAGDAEESKECCCNIWLGSNARWNPNDPFVMNLVTEGIPGYWVRDEPLRDSEHRIYIDQRYDFELGKWVVFSDAVFYGWPGNPTPWGVLSNGKIHYYNCLDDGIGKQDVDSGLVYSMSEIIAKYRVGAL